jgi:hypothetical protein
LGSSNNPAQYVAAIRDAFLALGTHGRFGPSEDSQALQLQRRNVPLQAVQDAMLIGACRKYVSWLNTGYSEPISSIRYFDKVIEEIQACPLRSGYREFLPTELKRSRRHWTREVEKSGLKREGCVFPPKSRLVETTWPECGPGKRRDDVLHLGCKLPNDQAQPRRDARSALRECTPKACTSAAATG